jgi:hypothetical protein
MSVVCYLKQVKPATLTAFIEGKEKVEDDEDAKKRCYQ